jgi:hypothetical protein
LTVVDHSDFSPNSLTAQETLLMLASQRSSPCFPFQIAWMIMALQVVLFLLVFLLLSLALLWRLCWLHYPSHQQAGKRRPLVHRLLKPRTPLDCPICRLCSSRVRPSSAPVRPWSEVKSRRRAPKRIHTAGFACPNQQCPYFGITDASSHASFGRWQAWLCRADPDVSRPCLPHHVQCSTAHSLVPFENPLLPDRDGAVGASLWTGPFRGSASLRLPTSHHHQPF